MSKPQKESQTMTADATSRFDTLEPLESSAHLALAPSKATLAPMTNERSFRHAALAAMRDTRKKAEQRIRALVEEKLKESVAAKNHLAVHDFFKNAPVGTPLHVYATDKPERAVPALIEALEASNCCFQTVGVVADLDVDTINNLGEFVADKARVGTMVQVIGQVASGTYEEHNARYIKKPIVSTAPGRDQFQIFADRVSSAQFDPNKVCARSLVPAYLGARALRDQEAIGQPVAGDLNTGAGSKGVLKGLKVVRPIANRLPMVRMGLNLCRDWQGVGGAVVFSNRSLLGNESSRYYCASTTRIRLGVMAMFYAITQRNILFGIPTKAMLEGSLGLFNSVLDQFIQDGLIEPSSRAWVDYGKLKLEMNVLIKPTQPANEIIIYVRENEPLTAAR